MVIPAAEPAALSDKGERDVVETVEFSPTVVLADEYSDVPRGYWTSFRFLGSVAAIVLLANNLFIGYSMPVRYLPTLRTVCS